MIRSLMLTTALGLLLAAPAAADCGMAHGEAGDPGHAHGEAKADMHAKMKAGMHAKTKTGMSACSAPAQACLDHVVASFASRGWAGLELEPGEDGTYTINEVVPGSPADRAGLRRGDVVVAAGGVRLAGNPEGLSAAHAGTRPGDDIVYTVRRGRSERSVTVTTASLPEPVLHRMIGQHMMMHASAHAAGPMATRAAMTANGIVEISIDDTARLVRSGDAVILDANNRQTRDRFGTIPRATLLTSADAYDVRSALPADKDTTLVFFCANPRCTASDQAAKRAVDAGYRDVRILREGIMGWKNAGQPTVGLTAAAS